MKRREPSRRKISVLTKHSVQTFCRFFLISLSSTRISSANEPSDKLSMISEQCSIIIIISFKEKLLQPMAILVLGLTKLNIITVNTHNYPFQTKENISKNLKARPCVHFLQLELIW